MLAPLFVFWGSSHNVTAYTTEGLQTQPKGYLNLRHKVRQELKVTPRQG